jgi:hypothetical protein
VVATTVALAFISFWRAASIVLSDLASSAFYAGGIAEQAVGKSAPWFVLVVMLFSFAVRSVYLESSSMFVRGGVYVVVRDAMGPFIARISVSSLLFDYILTGPISVVSAGQYLAGLVNEVLVTTHNKYVLPPNWFSAGFAVLVTIYFWWENTKGMHESSGKALRIMQITTVMVVIFLIWCPLTILLNGPAQIPPAPIAANLHFSDSSLGWFKGTIFPTISAVAVMIAIGHSLLSMSGFETLAQVYREIAYPKLKNLEITGNIVCVYAAVSTGLITLFAAMIIPDAIRPKYVDNLLGAFSFDPPLIFAGGPFSGRFGGDASFGRFLELSPNQELAWRTRIEGSLGIAEREFVDVVGRLGSEVHLAVGVALLLALLRGAEDTEAEQRHKQEMKEAGAAGHGDGVLRNQDKAASMPRT